MGDVRTFTKDGETRTAGTAAEAVKFKFDGWVETQEPLSTPVLDEPVTPAPSFTPTSEGESQ